jgi:hypothetical protein
MLPSVEVEPPTTATNTTHADNDAASHRVTNATSHCSRRPGTEINSTATTTVKKGRKQRAKNRKFSS